MSKSRTQQLKLGAHQMRYEVRHTPEGWRVLVWMAIGGDWDQEPTILPDTYADPRRAKRLMNRNLRNIRTSGDYY